MRRILRILCLILFITMGHAAPAAPQAHLLYSTDTVSIHTQTGDVKLVLEVAKSQAQMSNGLMFRKSVPEKTGMIFLFGAPQTINMWMKNTLVPLDMLFIDEHGAIINIAENTKPQSIDLIPSGGDVTSVIELAAGSAKRLNIAKGDKVIYPYFHE